MTALDWMNSHWALLVFAALVLMGWARLEMRVTETQKLKVEIAVFRRRTHWIHNALVLLMERANVHLDQEWPDDV